MDRILNLIKSSRTSLGSAIRRVHTRTANFELLRGGLRRMGNTSTRTSRTMIRIGHPKTTKFNGRNGDGTVNI